MKVLLTGICGFAGSYIAKEMQEHIRILTTISYIGGDLYFSFEQYVNIVDIYNEDLKAFAKDNNIHYIPVNEIACFETRDFLDICHIKQSGIEKKAKVISDYISNHL